MAHGKPAEDAECTVCMEEVTEESGLYVEYKLKADGPWLPSPYCVECIGHLLKTQFQRYVKLLEETTCKAEQRRLLEAGPPIHLKDKNGFKDENGSPSDGDVYLLWYARDGLEHSSKLEGALEGEARLKFWEEQRKFKIPDDAEE